MLNNVFNLIILSKYATKWNICVNDRKHDIPEFALLIEKVFLSHSVLPPFYFSFIQEIDYKTIMQAGYTTVSFVLDFSSHDIDEKFVVLQMKQKHELDVVRTKVKFFTRFDGSSPQR